MCLLHLATDHLPSHPTRQVSIYSISPVTFPQGVNLFLGLAVCESARSGPRQHASSPPSAAGDPASREGCTARRWSPEAEFCLSRAPRKESQRALHGHSGGSRGEARSVCGRATSGRCQPCRGGPEAERKDAGQVWEILEEARERAAPIPGLGQWAVIPWDLGPHSAQG